MPFQPPPCEKIAALMPTTAPRASISGPPEFPGLIDASIWMQYLTAYFPLAEVSIWMKSS